MNDQIIYLRNSFFVGRNIIISKWKRKVTIFYFFFMKIFTKILQYKNMRTLQLFTITVQTIFTNYFHLLIFFFWVTVCVWNAMFDPRETISTSKKLKKKKNLCFAYVSTFMLRNNFLTIKWYYSVVAAVIFCFTINFYFSFFKIYI